LNNTVYLRILPIIFFILFILVNFACTVSADINNGTGSFATDVTQPTLSFTPTLVNEIDAEHGIMHISKEEKHEDVFQYLEAPKAPDVKIDIRSGSKDLLSQVPYIPSERNQGNCGNCWVWASTGAMEVAHSISNGVHERLSIQYFDSNYNNGKSPGWSCEGGNINKFTTFYSTSGFGKAIPWANRNASFSDAGACPLGNCGGGTTMLSQYIETSPNYPLTGISSNSLSTFGVAKDTAINNMKAQIEQNKAVYYAFYLPDKSSWTEFNSFWNSQPETTLWNPDRFNEIPYSSSSGGGGHGVLIVGYNDLDASNSYWLVLNSWGTTQLRTRGVYRLDMNMDYSGTDATGSPNHLFYVLNPVFSGETPTITSTPTPTYTVTVSPTVTLTQTATVTPTITSTQTTTVIPTYTTSPTPTFTSTPTNTPTPTFTSTSTSTPTTTSITTPTATSTSSPTTTSTSIPSPTIAPTYTPTVTPTLTVTTVVPTLTPSQTMAPGAVSGSVRLESDPRGAIIFIDGTFKGNTPRMVTGILPGTHSLRISYPFCKDWTGSFVLDAGELTVLPEIILEKQ